MEGERDADGKFTFINNNGDDVTATDEDYKGYKVGFPHQEINQKLGNETLELFKNFSESELVKDLSGNDRFVMGRK